MFIQTVQEGRNKIKTWNTRVCVDIFGVHDDMRHIFKLYNILIDSLGAAEKFLQLVEKKSPHTKKIYERNVEFPVFFTIKATSQKKRIDENLEDVLALSLRCFHIPFLLNCHFNCSSINFLHILYFLLVFYHSPINNCAVSQLL